MPADRTSSAAITPWPSAESSMARPCGTCYRCGGTLYEYLTHFCTTSLRLPIYPHAFLSGRLTWPTK